MKKEVITINPPNLQTVVLTIVGISPLVINKFSAKAREEMKNKQMAGSVAKARTKREPKDFSQLYNEARHISAEGWDGLPAIAIRAGMVSACRSAGYVMTRAKLAFSVEPDGFDKDDMSPLVKIIKGEPSQYESYVRLSDGSPDIKVRPMWQPGWEASIAITFDADMLSKADIVNLLQRAGQQVGICAGRPDSSKSVGQGWGRFKIKEG